MKQYEFKTVMIAGKVFATAPDGKQVLMPPLTARTEREALRREFHIMEVEQQFDALIEKLETVELFSDEYNGMVKELRELEIKMSTLTRPPVSDALRGGIAEFSTSTLKNAI
jgi:hypothetical protein